MKTPKTTSNQTVEANVSRQIMQQVKTVLEQQVENLIDLIKKRDYLGWLMSLEDFEIDTMYHYFVHAVVESGVDEERLEALFEDQDFRKEFVSEIWRAIHGLGEKAARYFEEQLGFPENTLVFKYDWTVPVPIYGMVTDILSQYQFAIKTDRILNENEVLGEWVVDELHNDKHLVLRHTKSGGVLEFSKISNPSKIFSPPFLFVDDKEFVWINIYIDMRLSEMLEILNEVSPVQA